MKALCLLLVLWAAQQVGSDWSRQPQRRLTPRDVILQFAAKEAQFRQVWEQYTYKQHILFEELGPGQVVVAQRRLEVEVYFTSQGKRETRILSERGQLRNIRVTQADIQNAIELQPFVLTTEDLPYYRIDYLKQERVDELDTYVFDVQPRRMKQGQRYFQGRIWVDKQDLQIVMSRGKAVPERKGNKFPVFDTVRQKVDGQFWFPVWSEANEVLRFDNGNSAHIHELITYHDFRKFEVGIKIDFEDPSKKPEKRKDPQER